MTTAAIAVVWEAVAAVQGDLARLGAVMAVFSVVLLGLLPRLALMASGLTALDDRRSGGVSVSRHQVGNALAATHRGLALATTVTAVSAASAGWLLTLAADADRVDRGAGRARGRGAAVPGAGLPAGRRGRGTLRRRVVSSSCAW